MTEDQEKRLKAAMLHVLVIATETQIQLVMNVNGANREGSARTLEPDGFIRKQVPRYLEKTYDLVVC